jgi:hypothetical protein
MDGTVHLKVGIISCKIEVLQLIGGSKGTRDWLKGTGSRRQTALSLDRRCGGCADERILLSVAQRRAEAATSLALETERPRVRCGRGERVVELAGSGRTLIRRERGQAGIRSAIVLERIDITS